MGNSLPDNEEQRLAALHSYRILDTDAEEAYDEITRLAAYLCDTSFSAITLIDEERQWFKSVNGLNIQETKRDLSFCRHTILQSDLLLVPDTSHDPRFADNPYVVGPPNILFYAGVPLTTPEGMAIGSLCVLDAYPHDLSEKQQMGLRTLAHQVETILELRKTVLIQEQMQAESEQMLWTVQQSVSRLNEAQKLTHVGSWTYEVNTGIRHWSDEMFFLFGWDPSSGPPTYEDLASTVRAEDLENARRCLHKISSDAPTCEYELRLMRPDGSLRWIHATATGVFDGDQLLRVVGNSHDITEIKDTQAEREHRDEVLRLLGEAFAHTSEGITIADARLPDLPLIYCNPAFFELTGYSADEVIGRNCRFLQGDTTSSAVVQEVHDAIADGASCRVSLLNFKKDGSAFWNELTLSPVVDEQGVLTHYVGHQHDVTLRHTANEQITDILNKMTDAFFALDVDWKFTYLNEKSENILRASRDQILGKSIWELFPTIYNTAFEREYRQAMDLQQPVSFESFFPAHGKWYEVRAYPTLEGLAVYFRDTTDRKQAEEALQVRTEMLENILTAIPMQVFWKNRQMVYEGCNPSFARAIGCGSPDDVVGKTDNELPWSQKEREQFVRLDRQVLENNKPVFDAEEICRDEHGSPSVALTSKMPLHNAVGEIVGVLGVSQDITERKRLETERERLLTEARDQADHDPLTGLLNHRAFYTRLAEMINAAEAECSPLVLVMFDLDNFKFFNDAYGHVVGDDALRMTAEKLRSICQENDVLARFGGDTFVMIIPRSGFASAEEAENHLRAQLDGFFIKPAEHEAVVPLGMSVGAAFYNPQESNRSDLVRQADKRLRWLKTGGDAEAQSNQVRSYMEKSVGGYSMLEALVTAVDNKDRYTKRHSEDVMTYSLLIAEGLGMDERTQRTIAVSALLHDVGKIGVPDAILRKPGKLSEEEFQAVQQHPMMGAIIVQAVPGLEETLDAIRHHHERWDGAGYPFGLVGEETPLIGRLMAVADAFSAMTTDRPYRKGMNKDTALSLLKKGAGTQWDPKCVEVFLAAIDTAREKGIMETGKGI